MVEKRREEKRREWSRLHVVEHCGAQGGGQQWWSNVVRKVVGNRGSGVRSRKPSGGAVVVEQWWWWAAVLGRKFFRRNSLREGKKEGNRIARNSLLYMRALIHTKKNNVGLCL